MQDVISSVEIQNTTVGVLDLASLMFHFSEKRENVFSEIVEIHFCGRTYFLPGYITEKDAAKCIEKFKKYAKIPFHKIRFAKTRDFLEKSYMLESFGLEEEIAVLTYLEMPEDRRNTETGKAILSFMKKYGEYIVNLYIKKQDVKILKKVLELQLVSRKELRNIIFIRCQDADESVKKCLMDGLKKLY
mgnify:FL=1